MGTTMYDANFFERYRYWHEYNKRPGAPSLTTNNSIRARYNATFVGPPGQNAPPTVTIPHPLATRPVPRGRPIRKPRNMPLKDKLPWPQGGVYKGVTYQPFTAPQGGAPNWRAAKILGIGGGGAVVLWEYVGPLVIPPPVITKIVVKNKQNPDLNWLAAEGVFMQQLTASPTEHIVRLLAAPVPMTRALRVAQGTPGGRPRLTAAWDGFTRQLVMEYCPQGPLCRLIEERARRCLPLHELTIWRIFECIVDALSVLEYGAELVPNPATPGNFMPNPAFGPAPGPGMMVVHFDLKPENVFGTEPTAQGGSHPHRQTWKLGDFGLARNIPRVGYNMPLPAGTGWLGPPAGTYTANDLNLRRVGTVDYYVPEQFSPRWNYADYQTSSLCAKFGPHTNVWGLGAIMYEVACLDQGSVEPYYPFDPSALAAPYNINGAPALGITYGTRLRATQYSNLLRDTIQSCLYEEPVNRPSIQRLKQIVTNAIAMCIANGATPEGWHNLNVPEPRTQSQRRRAPSQFKQCTRRNGPLPTAVQCTTRVRVEPDNTRPRCKEHWNLVKFPHG